MSSRFRIAAAVLPLAVTPCSAATSLASRTWQVFTPPDPDRNNSGLGEHRKRRGPLDLPVTPQSRRPRVRECRAHRSGPVILLDGCDDLAPMRLARAEAAG